MIKLVFLIKNHPTNLHIITNKKGKHMITQSPLDTALTQLCDEKGLPKETIIGTIEACLAAAYRKEYGHPREIVRAKLKGDSLDLSKVQMFQIFKVVEDEDFTDENNQIKLTDAKKKKKKIKVDDEIEKSLPHQENFGRIAAQTAKQVIIQRLQEAERDVLYNEFKDKEHKLINGVVQQIEGRNIIINLGKINGVMPPTEQIPSERYFIGQRLRIFVEKVEETNRGPRILISRSKPEFIKELFSLEVPEIAGETVKIDAISREPGSRTKMAVSTDQESLDPVGSCVGQRGIRVQAVLAEIGDEKIDIILYDKDSDQFIKNALSPAKIEKIKLDKKNKQAKVYVSDDQLSLAIGKSGQNVRLASKLTGWGIDIEKYEEKKKLDKKTKDKQDVHDDKKDDKKSSEKKEIKTKAKKESK